jgi:hypothetical protein
MKTLTCKKCKATTMHVETRANCDDCANDTCVRGDDPEDCKHQCNTGSPNRCERWLSSCCEDHQCEMGDNHNYGCWIVTCAMCGECVEFLSMMEG